MSLRATEAIKEAKALCAWTIQDMETHCTVLIWKAEVQACCLYQGDWGWLHSCLSRGRELLLNSHQGGRVLRHFPSSAQFNNHIAKDIQCLEVQRPLREEGRDHLTFLAACCTTLRASPPEAHRIMVIPFHLLLWNAPTSALLSIPLGVSPPEQEPAPQTPPSSALAVTRPSPWSKWWYNLPDWVEPLSPSETTSKVTPKEPPHSKQKEEMLFHEALSRSCTRKALTRHSRLVWKVREDYYWENHPHFNSKTSCDMADIFWSMIESMPAYYAPGDLQDPGNLDWAAWSAIHQLSPKNPAKRVEILLHQVSPSESPKVMGVTGIHHPNALCHFNGVTHCLWCGKEGQNEGTVINHLQITHYKLGLVCKKCFCCLLVTSEAILAPWSQELPAFHRWRPWWIIFISLTTSAGYVRSTLMHQRHGPGQKIRWGIRHPLNCYIWEIPTPSAWTHMEDQGAHVKPRHTHHLNLLASCSGSGNVRMSPSWTGPPSCHTWWSGHCHPRTQQEPVYLTPGARYTCPIGHLFQSDPWFQVSFGILHQ